MERRGDERRYCAIGVSDAPRWNTRKREREVVVERPSFSEGRPFPRRETRNAITAAVSLSMLDCVDSRCRRIATLKEKMRGNSLANSPEKIVNQLTGR